MGTTMAVVSDNLMTVTVMVYSLAMLGYAAEFAFGRVARGEQVAERTRVLAGAGGPEVGATQAAKPDGSAPPGDAATEHPSAGTVVGTTGGTATIGRVAEIGRAHV